MIIYKDELNCKVKLNFPILFTWKTFAPKILSKFEHIVLPSISKNCIDPQLVAVTSYASLKLITLESDSYFR